MPSTIIPNTPPYEQYTAIASQTVFAVPFKFFWDQVSYPNPLLVYLTPSGAAADDVDDILTNVTDYTITQNIDYTGTVTLVVPASAGDIVTIVRDMNNVRYNLYINGGAFTANAINTDFESEVLYIQQNTFANRFTTPHYNYSATVDAPGDVVLPVLGANEIWVKDPTGTFIMATEIPGGGGGGGGLVMWEMVSINTAMVAGHGYICAGAGTTTLTTPSSFTVGDTFAVMISGSGIPTIQLGAGQTIRIGQVLTSAGGTLTFANTGDTLIFVATSSTRLQILSGVTLDYSYT